MADVSFDTSILIRAVDRRDLQHARAAGLLDRATAVSCMLPLQTFGEFYHATTRNGLASPAEAKAFIAVWRAVFEVGAADVATMDEAIEAVDQHGLGFWDALLWATLRRARCRFLFTEDLEDGLELDGVRIINPFLPANEPLVDLVLPPLASA